MIAANELLFERLAKAAGEIIPPEVRKQKRAVRTDAIEKKWLKDVTLRSSSYLALGPTSRFALGEYDGDLFLIAIGVDVIDPPADLQPTKLNAGIFTAIVSDLCVPILHTGDLAQRLREYVFYPAEENVELLDMDTVAPFFQRIALFRIDPASSLTLDKDLGLRAATAAILGAPQTRALSWPTSAVDRINFMVRDPAERAPFHLILRALTETRDDAAFLSLYRCIEQLFPIPAMIGLSAELGLENPALHVALIIERHLGWRRREEDAIAHLFSELGSDLIDRIGLVIGSVALDEKSFRTVSKRIYELRNQCVHYRPIHAAIGSTPFQNWLPLADLLLEAIQCLYAQYMHTLSESRPLAVA